MRFSGCPLSSLLPLPETLTQRPLRRRVASCRPAAAFVDAGNVLAGVLGTLILCALLLIALGAFSRKL